MTASPFTQRLLKRLEPSARRMAKALAVLLVPEAHLRHRPGPIWEDDPPDSSMRPPPVPRPDRPRLSLEPGLVAIDRADGGVHVQRDMDRWTRLDPTGPGWYQCVWHSPSSDNPPVRIHLVEATAERPLSVQDLDGSWRPLDEVKWWGARIALQGPPPSEEENENGQAAGEDEVPPWE